MKSDFDAENASTSYATVGAVAPKSEDVTMADVMNPLPDVPEDTKPSLYTIYTSAAEIPYLPEDALKEGVGMVHALKASINKLELGSKLRKDVWLREIDRFVAWLSVFRIVLNSLSLVFRIKGHLQPWLPFVEVYVTLYLVPVECTLISAYVNSHRRWKVVFAERYSRRYAAIPYTSVGSSYTQWFF